MSATLLTLPLLIPLVTALATLALRGRDRLERVASVAGGGALLLAALALLGHVRVADIAVVQLGDWPAPFGITLVADLLGAILVVLAAVMGLTTLIYSLGAVDPARQRHFFHPLVHLLLMGVSGAFLTGDLFSLYVWFEVTLITSFVLIALGGTRAQLEGALQYVTLNLVASLLLLTGVGLLYGLTGTLNLADLARVLPEAPDGPALALAMLLLVAFGTKAGLFPFFFWLPAAYPVAPLTVSALFAGLLSKVGVYALIRLFTLLFVPVEGLVPALLTGLAGITMVVGVLGAATQGELRRILAFHSVSQVGYMVMGLALLTPLALAGTIFFMLHHSLVKANLFLISGLLREHHASEQLSRLGGNYAGRPGLALLFLLPALSLAGLPPLSGFWAKLALVRGGLEVEAYALVATALAVGLLTLYSMTKIWSEAFWKPLPEGGVARVIDRARSVAMLAPVVTLTALTLLLGLAAEPVLALSLAAAEQLLEPARYVAVVLGETPVAGP